MWREASTLGNISSAHVSIPAADIGLCPARHAFRAGNSGREGYGISGKGCARVFSCKSLFSRAMSQTNAPVRLPGDCPGSQILRRPWRFRFRGPVTCGGDLTVIVKVVPPPGVSETKMPPWWASMISLAMESPSPKCPRALAGGVGTVKTVEQMRFFFVWDSGAVVHDTKGGKLFLLLHGKRNIAPFGTEAESIMKKNREHLPDAFRIRTGWVLFFLRKPDGQA